MSKYAFFLNSHNDIDNIIPVIWKFLEKNEDIIVIFGTNYDFKKDYRIKYLQQNYSFKIFTFTSDYKQISKEVVHRHFKYLLGLYGKYEMFLKYHDISVCIFEWKVFYSSNLQNMFFGAAKKLKIPTIAIPHGVSIYTNFVVTENDKQSYKNCGKIQQIHFSNDMELSVEPNLYTQKLHWYAGVESSISEVWGSARYYYEWAKINLSICPKFEANKSTEGKLKIVLMLPHWEYNVHVRETLSLIDYLANLTWIYLVIKDHTRGNGGLEDSFRAKLNSLPNVEASVSAHSPALIQWSDVVINFGSSIGIEAILQDKILINPSYLHENETIFELTSSAIEPIDNNDLIKILNDIRNDKIISISQENKDLLIKESVYGGREKYDILEHYWEQIKTYRNRMNYRKPANHYKIIYRNFLSHLKLKLPTIKMLLKNNPIKSVEYISNWISKTYIR